MGENTALDYAEKLDVAAGDEARRRTAAFPCLTGVAEYTTALACRFARDAEKIGARRPDGAARPWSTNPTSAKRLAHFRTIAHSTGLPIMIYNNPVSYGVDVPPEAFAELADVENIVAIKESSENVRRITDLVQSSCGDRYILFAGVDDLVLESVLLGVAGLDLRPGERLPAGEPRAVGPGHRRPLAEGARAVPLVHPAAAPRHQGEAGAVHQAGHGGNAGWVRRWCARRACRSWARSARRFWRIIRHAIATRPALAAAVHMMAATKPGERTPHPQSIDSHTGGEPTRVVVAAVRIWAAARWRSGWSASAAISTTSARRW